MQEDDRRDDDTTPPADPAATRRSGARTCMRWGITSMALGALAGVILYTSVANGADVHPEVSRGGTTLAIGGLVCGLMGVLAATIMRHVDRVGAARLDIEERIEATQTQIAEELVKIHAGISTLLSVGVRSTADWDQKIEQLRDELSKQIGEALVEGLRAEGTIVSFRNRKPL